MLYSQSPPLADDDAAEEDSPQEFARDRDGPSRTAVWPAARHAPMYAASAARPSIGRRMFRAMTRFAIAVLIGVGATLGWQAYGDTAKQMLAAHAPELAWVLSYLPSTQPPAAVAAAPSPALQLEPLAANLASNLEIVRRSVEQLALKQEQMAQEHRGAAGRRRGYPAEGVARACRARPGAAHGGDPAAETRAAKAAADRRARRAAPVASPGTALACRAE